MTPKQTTARAPGYDLGLYHLREFPLGPPQDGRGQDAVSGGNIRLRFNTFAYFPAYNIFDIDIPGPVVDNEEFRFEGFVHDSIDPLMTTESALNASTQIEPLSEPDGASEHPDSPVGPAAAYIPSISPFSPHSGPSTSAAGEGLPIPPSSPLSNVVGPSSRRAGLEEPASCCTNAADPMDKSPVGRSSRLKAKKKAEGSRLLELPGEMRNQIYREVLLWNFGEPKPPSVEDPTQRRLEPSLLRPNKQIYGEASHILYSENKWLVVTCLQNDWAARKAIKLFMWYFTVLDTISDRLRNSACTMEICPKTYEWRSNAERPKWNFITTIESILHLPRLFQSYCVLSHGRSGMLEAMPGLDIQIGKDSKSPGGGTNFLGPLSHLKVFSLVEGTNLSYSGPYAAIANSMNESCTKVRDLIPTAISFLQRGKVEEEAGNIVQANDIYEEAFWFVMLSTKLIRQRNANWEAGDWGQEDIAQEAEMLRMVKIFDLQFVRTLLIICLDAERRFRYRNIKEHFPEICSTILHTAGSNGFFRDTVQETVRVTIAEAEQLGAPILYECLETILQLRRIGNIIEGIRKLEAMLSDHFEDDPDLEEFEWGRLFYGPHEGMTATRDLIGKYWRQWCGNPVITINFPSRRGIVHRTWVPHSGGLKALYDKMSFRLRLLSELGVVNPYKEMW